MEPFDRTLESKIAKKSSLVPLKIREYIKMCPLDQMLIRLMETECLDLGADL